MNDNEPYNTIELDNWDDIPTETYSKERLRGLQAVCRIGAKQVPISARTTTVKIRGQK